MYKFLLKTPLDVKDSSTPQPEIMDTVTKTKNTHIIVKISKFLAPLRI